MDEKDREKAEREKARNALETYIFDIQDKLYQPSHEKVSTQEERESLLKSFKETSEWLDEDSGAEGASIYKAKLKALETLMKDIVERVTETKKRPEMLEELDKQIGLAKTFMEFMTNGSLNGVFTETEVDGIKKLLKDTEDWKRTNVELQEKSSLTSAPVLRVADIVEKGRALDREVNYLLNKMKIAKSKAKTEKKDKKPAESAAKSNDTTKHKPEDSGDNVSQDDSTLQDIKDNEDDTNQEKTPAVDEEGTGREESVSGEAENASGPESSRKQTKGGKEPVTHSPEDL